HRRPRPQTPRREQRHTALAHTDRPRRRGQRGVPHLPREGVARGSPRAPTRRAICPQLLRPHPRRAHPARHCMALLDARPARPRLRRVAVRRHAEAPPGRQRQPAPPRAGPRVQEAPVNETVDLSARQAAAGRQGAAFETTVATLLQIEGWTITATKWRHPEVDIEIDIVATHPQTGEEWWIECKGSWEGNRQGLKRTDTLKKALFNGAMLALVDDRRPYMIIASHPPSDGTAGRKWIERARGVYVTDVRYLTSLGHGAPEA